MRIEELPELLTVEEAASVLRISRTTAYSQAHRFERTGGDEGMPVARVGRGMRVPKAALLRWIDAGRTHDLDVGSNDAA